MKKSIVLICGLLLLFGAAASDAAVIRSATVIQNTMGEYGSAFGIDNVLNQSGLSANYVDGITDWDVYFGNPIHSLVAYENEWWGAAGVDTGIIDFDLGAVYHLDKIALWNEDAVGIAQLAVYTSLTSDFSSSAYVGTFIPTDWAYSTDYYADFLNVAASDARYVRLDIVASYDPDYGASMGEIAFRTSDVAPVPEPATMLLLGSGLIGLAGIRRKIKKV